MHSISEEVTDSDQGQVCIVYNNLNQITGWVPFDNEVLFVISGLKPLPFKI